MQQFRLYADSESGHSQGPDNSAFSFKCSNVQPSRQNVTGAIVTEQAWLVAHDGLVATGRGQRQFDCVRDVLSTYMLVQSFQAMM